MLEYIDDKPVIILGGIIDALTVGIDGVRVTINLFMILPQLADVPELADEPPVHTLPVGLALQQAVSLEQIIHRH